MSVQVIDCDDGMGNIIELRGMVTDREYVDALKDHLSQNEEKFSKYKYSLLDAMSVTRADVSTEAIKLIADLCIDASKINPDPIIALATESDFLFGLSRMYEGLISETDWETMVFKSTEEAIEWIRQRVREKFGIDHLTFT